MPEKTLYKITTDYHWPSFQLNKTLIAGNPNSWKDDASGIGYGPFGFGSSVILQDDAVRN